VDQLRSARSRESQSSFALTVSPIGAAKARKAGQQRQVSWFGGKVAASSPLLALAGRRLSLPDSSQQVSPPNSPPKEVAGPTPVPTPRKLSAFGDSCRPPAPVLRGVARLGKEWNLCCGDCPLVQSGAVAFDHCLRSASDLFSVQDINQHIVSLPRDFYTTNHRAFSGPPLWCLAPEPKCLPVPERRRILETDVEAEFETFGLPRSRQRSIAHALPKRRMTRVPMNVPVVAGQINSLCVAPMRAAFRLSFAPGGAPQPNPCRPVARSCDKCTREYYWQEECPRCTAVAGALRRYTIGTEGTDETDPLPREDSPPISTSTSWHSSSAGSGSDSWRG